MYTHRNLCTSLARVLFCTGYRVPILKKDRGMTLDGIFLCWQIHFLMQRHFENPIWFGSLVCKVQTILQTYDYTEKTSTIVTLHIKHISTFFFFLK